MSIELDVDGYVENSFACPRCGAYDPKEEFETYEDDFHFIQFECQMCGLKWEERWQLKRVLIIPATDGHFFT